MDQGMPRPASKRRAHTDAGFFARAAAYALLVALAAVFAFPFYWLFVNAFKSMDQIFTLPPQFLPHPWRFENFARVYRETHILRAFLNSSVIAAAHSTLALFLCSLGGYAFAKFPAAPGRDRLFAFVLATMMIPGAVTMIPVFLVLCSLHAANTYWAMILPGAAGAFGIFWLNQYTAANVPNDLVDAARIDGCSEFGIYWRVALPILKPALAALGILLVLGSWNNLMWAYIVMRTEDMYTLPLVIYLLNGELRIPYGLIMAASLLATVPLVVAFLVFQRQFIEGITAGAIKA